MTLAKCLLTVVAIFTIFYALLADISSTHLFNQSWPEHARFHLAQFLSMVVINGFLALWVLWGSGISARKNITISAILLLAFWTPILWVTSIVPGTDLLGDPSIPVLVILGVKVYVNVIAAALATFVIVCAWILSRRNLSKQ